MNGGIDQQVQQAMLSAQGNPQVLAQRNQGKPTPDLIDLLAMQKMKSEKDAAAKEMQMQMQQKPQTIVEQREAELMGQTKKEMIDKIAPTMKRTGQEQLAAMNKPGGPMPGSAIPMKGNPAQSGIAGAMPPKKFSMGGIVGFEGGGDVELRAEIQQLLKQGARIDKLEAVYRNNPNALRIIREISPPPEVGRNIPAGKEFDPQGPDFSKKMPAMSDKQKELFKHLLNKPEVGSGGPPIKPPVNPNSGAAGILKNPPTPPAGQTGMPMPPATPVPPATQTGAPVPPANWNPGQAPKPAPSGIEAVAPEKPVGPGVGPLKSLGNKYEEEYLTPPKMETKPLQTAGGAPAPVASGIDSILQKRINQDPDAAFDKMADKYKANTTGTAKGIEALARQRKDRQGMTDAINDPDKRRREELKAFLMGAGGRSTFGSVMSGGLAGSMNARNRNEKQQLKDFDALTAMMQKEQTATTAHEKGVYGAGSGAHSAAGTSIDQNLRTKAMERANELRAEQNTLERGQINTYKQEALLKSVQQEITGINDKIRGELAFDPKYREAKKALDEALEDNKPKDAEKARARMQLIEEQARVKHADDLRAFKEIADRARGNLGAGSGKGTSTAGWSNMRVTGG